MIKKISILLIITIMIFSCGKKGDPVHKEQSKNLRNISTQMSVFS